MRKVLQRVFQIIGFKRVAYFFHEEFQQKHGVAISGRSWVGVHGCSGKFAYVKLY